MKSLPVLIVALLFLAGLSHAKATCALDSFQKSCDSCSFDAYGKLDKNCWKQYESEGTTCLALAYPIMSIKYPMGFCSQMDECVSRLSACKERYKSGSDLVDCKNADMIQCFVKADNCAQAANAVCAEGKTEEDAGFDNESAGGPIKETPPEPEPPTVKPPSRTTDQIVVDFCGPMLILLLLAGFVMKD